MCKNNSTNSEKDTIRKILTSTPYLVVSGIAMFLGLTLNILKMLGVADKVAFIIGIVLFLLGWILSIIAGISSYIGYKKSTKELTEINDQINQLRTEFKKEMEDLKDELTLMVLNNEFLTEKAHNGLQYTLNQATITFDKKNKIYRFTFEKHFKIISDIVPEYYQAQFYANKFITDKDKAYDFYSKNPISWQQLNVRAIISYKKKNQTKFTKEEWLEVINICDNINYIPFKIMYKKFKDKSKINLEKDTEIKLKYCYQVPVDVWGSYINRSVSYFNEETNVILKYDSETALNYEIEEILPNGTPIILSSDEYTVENSHNGVEQTSIISIKSERYKRYRIKWGAKDYFNISEEDTEDGVDQLGLTNR